LTSVKKNIKLNLTNESLLICLIKTKRELKWLNVEKKRKKKRKKKLKKEEKDNLSLF
jgi:hypothetical protein